jgi:hypothetical protein
MPGGWAPRSTVRPTLETARGRRTWAKAPSEVYRRAVGRSAAIAVVRPEWASVAAMSAVPVSAMGAEALAREGTVSVMGAETLRTAKRSTRSRGPV